MEQQTITMGQVTYELSRVFQGTRSLSELMAARQRAGLEVKPCPLRVFPGAAQAPGTD